MASNKRTAASSLSSLPVKRGRISGSERIPNVSTRASKRASSANSSSVFKPKASIQAFDIGAAKIISDLSPSTSRLSRDSGELAATDALAADLNEVSTSDCSPILANTTHKPSYYVPEDIQMMIGRYCLATWTDQELWFGLSRVNRLFRELVERDVVSGRLSSSEPDNEGAQITTSEHNSNVSDHGVRDATKSGSVYSKFPFQTTGEMKFRHEAGFAERQRGVYNLHGTRGCSFTQFEPTDWSTEIAGPYMWFHMIADWDALDHGNRSFPGINRILAFDHIQGSAQGSPEFYRANFCSVGELTYKQMSREEADAHRATTGERLEPGTWASYQHPSLAKIRSSKRDLLLQFDSTGKKYGIKAQTEIETHRGKRIDFWVCALSQERLIREGARDPGFLKVEAIDCEVDVDDPKEAVLYLTIDWREMWTKKLARERVAEMLDAAFERAIVRWQERLMTGSDYSHTWSFDIPLVDIDGDQATLRLRKTDQHDVWRQKNHQRKIWQLPDGIGGTKEWTFCGLTRTWSDEQSAKQKWFVGPIHSWS